MKLLTVTFLFVLGLSTFAQEIPKNSMYTKVGIYELSLGYERELTQYLSVGLEADYRPSFSESSYHNHQWYQGGGSFTGMRTRVFVNLFSKKNYYGKNQIDYLTIAPSYRFLRSNRLVYDAGKFSGSNSADYAEYTQSGNEFGVNLLYSKSFAKAPSLHWYVGVGAFLQFVERHYSIEGYYTGQFPSDRVDNIKQAYPAIHLGLKICLFNWGVAD